MTKILIVDDHPDIRQLIRLTLGNQYEIHEASDATSALRLAREHRPHVVVMDIMMPGEMDGLQALQAIRSDAALTETKVIMVTARASANDQATAAAGVVGLAQFCTLGFDTNAQTARSSQT